MKYRATQMYAHLQARITAARNERGDLVGWLLIAVMTAALIAVIWGTLGGQLQRMIQSAINEAQSTANNM